MVELHGPLVAGVGARPGTPADAVLALLDEALAGAGLDRAQLVLLATVEARATEPGLREAARILGVPLTAHPAAVLAAVPVPNPSAAVRAALGTPGVAEAAALAEAPGGHLVVPKTASRTATVAIARRAAADTAGSPDRPATPRENTAMSTDFDLRHHGDAEVRAAGLVDLAVNVRTGTPPGWLRDRLAATLADLAAYPDPAEARAAVAARHRRPAGEVLLTAGAAEAFVLLARVVAARHVCVVHPQFTEPEAALRDAGHTVHRAVLRAGDGFRLTPGAVPEEADLVVIGNPTNPTSVLHPAEDVAALARPGRTLVVDEAFMDTVPGESAALADVRGLPGRVVVLRSLTKTWGLAGLRIGYVLGPAELIAELAAAQPLWPVSTPALAAAEACSAPAALAEAEEAAHELAAHRAHLLAGLRGVPGARVHGTPASSFLLVELDGAAAVRERLRAAGFAVRRGDTFPGLGPDWLRIAVRDPATADRFLAALAAAVGDPPAGPVTAG
ncbi:Rv2231c family pyridoxal phosphate-dependent protein CobC [Streptomyces sp. NRRL B-24484]|uniref:Rv2231c family pyridoxal phosphate-dependent protein CobC n=1 Tax=Streptomyces sp. NRRL B-24484 TaxID=1463833 RepID=UPI001F422BB2|nr:Rv2231c family pyridoxal phosphate-dependent protein CobC [Streptomyces sp. NRRL B-24484]